MYLYFKTKPKIKSYEIYTNYLYMRADEAN